MARISGINIPKEKKVKIGLRYIYGVGPNVAMELLEKAGVDPEKRVHELSNDEVDSLQKAVQEFRVEGELRRSIKDDVQRLIKIASYRGSRHRRGLPVRGQRTKTNARTRKGKKKVQGAKKR